MAGQVFGKKDLVQAVLSDFELTNKDAAAIVNLMLDTMSKQLKKGNKVQLIPFGTFTVTKRAARKGRNPKTGEALKIKASKSVRFKASTTLKKAV